MDQTTKSTRAALHSLTLALTKKEDLQIDQFEADDDDVIDS